MKYFKIASILMVALFATTSLFAQSDSTASFHVSGACGMCKQRIEKTLKIPGVVNAQWDMHSQQLTVKFKPGTISLDAIHDKVAEAGHDTELKKSTDETYNALPDCCLYRGMDAADINEDQHFISGIILSEDNKGNFKPLQDASIVWLNSQKGTTSDEHGVFKIAPDDPDDKLIISYAGFQPDTLEITSMSDVQVILGTNNVLKAVQINSTARNTFINTFNPIRVQTITSRELLKAACCNLSESFETNPSVDVSYNDAVTGSKQIQLLGLSGNYTQLTVENLPGPRGIATPLGLNSIAGPWIESIQLSKGTGSVVNGFESIAGQINVELKKPENSEKLYLNGYLNSMGRTDLNANLAVPLNNKWSMGLLLHDDFLYNKTDFNNDGFRDQPTGNLFSAINRWNYNDGKGFISQFGFKVLLDDKTGGEVDFSPADKLTTNRYGVGINTERYEGFAKFGYVFENKKYKSIGLQVSAFRHNQDAFFGLTTYNAEQRNVYANLIYQSIIGNTMHKFRTGLSVSADEYDEDYNAQQYKRKELVPGSFFEYTWTPGTKFSAVAGIRADYNSLFGWFTTPRLNLRYEPVAGTTIRGSVGRGQRTANIFAENMGALASSRQVAILSAEPGKAYGLDPEVAWNKGISVDQRLKLFGNPGMISVDFYRNDFTNQVIADMEDPRHLNFYNLDGKSYSNSLQAEFSFIPVKNLDVRLAYRWFDVKATYGDKLLQKPFTATHRAFANLGYEISGWKFDYTVNYVGEKRIPSTLSNPQQYRLESSSPSYFTMNAQVSKLLNKKHGLEVYIGGENLTSFMQDRAIIAADQPFSPYFDASMIWGPLTERMIYGGVRFKL